METIEQYVDALQDPSKSICIHLKRSIEKRLPSLTGKLYHGSPVWFMDDNPILGFSLKKKGISLLFWSGQSFPSGDLQPVGKFKAAEVMFQDLGDLDDGRLGQWFSESLGVQWNYRDIVKKKGKLELLI